MKRILKGLCFSGILILLLAFIPIFASAEEAREESGGVKRYLVSEGADAYTLLPEGAEGASETAESLSELLELLPDGAFVSFEGVSSDENIKITGKSITLSGTLSFSEGNSLILAGENIIFEDADFSFDYGGVRIKSGKLTYISGTVKSENSALVQEEADSGVFEMRGGSLRSSSDSPAYIFKRGSAYLHGGEISSLGEYALVNQASLYLSRSFSLVSKRYSLCTDRAITLLEGEAKSALLIKYNGLFEKGTLTEILLDSLASDSAFVRIYDENSMEFEARFFDVSRFSDEKCFTAVFNSFKLEFKDSGKSLFVLEAVKNEAVTPPPPEERAGYTFSGWYFDEALTKRCYFDSVISSDMVFYAGFTLNSPQFGISSHSAKYDGRGHSFGLDFVSHPLEGEGSYSYEWYKDGAYFFAGESITLVNAADSGEYSCKITFTHGTVSVSIMTLPVELVISKAELTPPQIKAEAYTGRQIMPSILPSTLYTAECSGGTDAGIYYATFTLTDTSNYSWYGSDGESVFAEFEILQAENSFAEPFEVFDVYFLKENSFCAKALFGECRVEFYESDGVSLISGIPAAPGEYYAEAYTEETKNYTALRSPLLKFSILEESAVGLSVLTPPDISEYSAFDVFNPQGLSVLVSYNSGRAEAVLPDRLGFSYQSADSFRFGDSAVKVSYQNTSVFVPVTVKKTSYDISGVVFEDSVFEYCGSYIYPAFTGTLPVGRDGIPLRAEVRGCGMDSGTYNVYLVFDSASTNYNVPEEICKTLTVIPKKTVLTWDKTEFVYNGEKQCPSAVFLDVFGIKRIPDVRGGAYTAAELYTAYAEEWHNYSFENPSVSFSIKKADYDMSGAVWPQNEFVYTGESHSVAVSGLPQGVTVGGYSNNTAKNAGKYTAEVKFVYDYENYNEPKVQALVWCILPAEYDLSKFSFSDSEAVFDGNEHYPLFNGEMPVGEDGSVLEYRFSGGARHVSDGTVTVKISFYTESGNYKIPESITRTVSVKPAPISVVWYELSFVYNSGEHKPYAEAEECSVTVGGAGVNAGEYTAHASADNSDYYILNPNITFEILKAENYFTEKPYVKDIFEGEAADAGASAFFGELVFSFYKDYALSEAALDIKTTGIYYMRAFVPESENFHALYSDILEFEVVKIIPVGINIVANKTEFRAFETVNPEDFTAFIMFNNGNKESLSNEDIIITYEKSDSFRVTDTSVGFSYDEFDFTLPVNVVRAVYDLSTVCWGGLNHVYDGTQKRAELSGLPSSVTLVRIEGGVGTSAGEYSARAVFEYDGENYEMPVIPDALMIIERAVVKIPEFAPRIYNSSNLFPSESSPLWSTVFTQEAKNAGEYEIEVRLEDAENYVFENGERSTSCLFRILPCPVKIEIPDVKLYLGQKYEHPKAEITGEIAEGDSLGISYTVFGDTVSAELSNPNYTLIVEEGKIIRSYLPEPRVRTLIYIILLCIILLILIIIVFMRKRHMLASVLVNHSENRRIEKEKSLQSEEPKVGEDGISREENAELQAFFSPMNPQRADSLISNSLARELIGEEGECVFTRGKRRSVVNIDTLSENFSSGDKIDVNILKQKSLIPYDTGYIKVLARGILDKPLYVYANDFSTTAVKMLALTGGKAYKISTVHIKKQ